MPLFTLVLDDIELAMARDHPRPARSGTYVPYSRSAASTGSPAGDTQFVLSQVPLAPGHPQTWLSERSRKKETTPKNQGRNSINIAREQTLRSMAILPVSLQQREICLHFWRRHIGLQRICVKNSQTIRHVGTGRTESGITITKATALPTLVMQGRRKEATCVLANHGHPVPPVQTQPTFASLE
ncbi:hypothetical protein Ac2012v2_006800 [Leucoagaricus gongylophorus]